MIRVAKAPAYATIQDGGRRGFLANGVPRAGAMDQAALLSLNALLGNDPRAAAIEWALTGGQLELAGSVVFAIGGADADVTLRDHPVEPYRAYRASAGDVLSVKAITRGRFLYVAFSGGVDSDLVMNSRSTYLPAGFGGVDGRRLKTGDTLSSGKPKARHLPQVSDSLPSEMRPPLDSDVIHYVPRDSAGTHQLSGQFSISPASDRTGFRLVGSVGTEGGSITSEPVCPGTIQLPPGGEPIVLMADAPTIGGYRILGAVTTADLGVLAQRMPGEVIRLEPVSVKSAQSQAVERAEVIERIREWALG